MKLPPGGFRDIADLLRFLETTSNDLEAPARALQPVIGEVLKALKGAAGRVVHPHVGIGRHLFRACCRTMTAARARRHCSRQKYPGWWVQPTFAAEIGIVHEDRGRDIGPTPDGL